MKSLKISTKIQTTMLVYERECLISSSDGNNHSKATFMMINRVLERSPNFRKFEKSQNLSLFISRISVVLKFFLIQTSMLLQNAAKGWKVLATADRIYEPLNWAYITVMSMGQYHLLLSFFCQCTYTQKEKQKNFPLTEYDSANKPSAGRYHLSYQITLFKFMTKWLFSHEFRLSEYKPKPNAQLVRFISTFDNQFYQ